MSADHITTVSPTYAREILTPARGEGLDGVLRARSSVLTGILNGVDTNEWNPATDPLIAHCFDAERLDARALNKAALRRELGLTKTSGPLLAVVSRLTAQKGLDLLLAAIPNAIQRGAQLVVLGSGEPALEAAFKALGANHPVHVAVRLGFDEALAHRIFAGADAIVIPSQFEPCGLTQLYGLRYGAVPIVHRVGGLADTVTDAATHSSAAPGTGLVFEEPTAESLSHALQRALALFDQPRRWQALVRAGMNTPVDWDRAAKAYSTLYTGAVAQR